MPNELELRILNMVWVVLAATSSAACGSVETRSSSGAGPTDTSRSRSTSTSTSTVTVATSTATATAVAVIAVPPEDPRAPCVAYQARASTDPKGPRTQVPAERQSAWRKEPADVTADLMVDGKVHCRIVWSRTPSTKAILVAPTCCPQAMSKTPCPPASLQRFPSELAKVETVVLAKDGSVESRTLVWSDWTAEPQRHNCGRRPEGFVASEGGDGPGACLAEMAELEAASISAFDRLARELAAHGAPLSLVDRARAARRDEIRHARSIRSLARRFGAEPGRSRARKLPVRAAVDIAIENAVEGCVFETFGAVVATFQSARAEDPAVRAALARIAADERAHAALAADVDAWFGGVLTPEQRADVDQARADARGRLAASRPTDRDAIRLPLGLPSASEHAALTRAVCSMT